jgi:hypothetical protein
MWIKTATMMFCETCSTSETRARVRRADVGPIRDLWLLLFDRVSTTSAAVCFCTLTLFLMTWLARLIWSRTKSHSGPFRLRRWGNTLLTLPRNIVVILLLVAVLRLTVGVLQECQSEHLWVPRDAIGCPSTFLHQRFWRCRSTARRQARGLLW